VTAPLVRPIQPGDRREWERMFGATITAVSNTTAQRLYDDVATRATWVTYEKET
jgi:hypothetical protein